MTRPAPSYCVACQTVHQPPVAVAVNDRCPQATDARLPERDATPDEAFELGRIAGYDEGHRDGLKAAGPQTTGTRVETCFVCGQPKPCQAERDLQAERTAPEKVDALIEAVARLANLMDSTVRRIDALEAKDGRE